MARAAALLAAALPFAAALLPLAAADAVFPEPFTRRLAPGLGLRGSDVTILQHLLTRAPAPCALTCDTECGQAGACGCSGVYDDATAASIACWTNSSVGVFSQSTAWRVLSHLSSDGYMDDGTPARLTGHKYKILLPVHRNRSIETTATLLDGNNTKLYTFRVRTHGHDVDASGLNIGGRPWPDFHDVGCPAGKAAQGCIGLNEFSSDGATPTGLSEIDLNSPEDEPKEFGPYPVNRFVRGLRGNAAFVLTPPCDDQPAADRAPPHPLRSGILMHTGAWSNYSSWEPGLPMPNSDGCVHAYPEAIHTIWRLLVERCGVIVRPNTGGKLPYPYAPQGLVAVYRVD